MKISQRWQVMVTVDAQTLQVSADYLAHYAAVAWLQLFGALLVTAGVWNSEMSSFGKVPGLWKIHEGNMKHTWCQHRIENWVAIWRRPEVVVTICNPHETAGQPLAEGGRARVVQASRRSRSSCDQASSPWVSCHGNWNGVKIWYHGCGHWPARFGV